MFRWEQGHWPLAATFELIEPANQLNANRFDQVDSNQPS